jgi:phosphoglycerate dehydrogenase-like enzyme
MTRRAVFNMQDERPVWAPPAWVTARLRAALPADFELIEVAAPVSGRGDGSGVSDEAVATVRGAEIYLGLGLPRELLHAALARTAALRWIHTGAAGVASLLHPELREHGITLTNSAGIHGPAMAETALGMMLHFARGLDYAAAAQRRGDWDTAPFERTDSGIRELAGATLGIIGYGGIGRELGARASALGMRVLALRRRGAAAAADAGGEPVMLAGEDALPRLLTNSDFVVVAVPSTPATRGMIGAEQLGLLRRDAVLINIARGDVIDEAALLDTLRARRIRGAALDVFTTEPLPASSPFWQLDNVLITPHVSGTTPRFWEREAALIEENLARYLRGEPLRNVVDLDAGY